MPRHAITQLAAALSIIAGAVTGCSSSNGATQQSPAPTSVAPAPTESTTPVEPHGGPVPAALRGKWFARFSDADVQTAGVWHLVLGPGHHAFIWVPGDSFASSPDFEGGPVYFTGHLMTFGLNTARGECPDSATYRWAVRDGKLHFTLVGEDTCGARQITFPVHPWHR
jgi:hypothetical protein